MNDSNNSTDSKEAHKSRHVNHFNQSTIKSSNHSSRILKNKKSAIDLFGNKYYNSNVVGDHLNFLPIKNNNYQLNDNQSKNEPNDSNDIADLINTYNLLDKKQAKMKRPKSAFFQPNAANQTKSLSKTNNNPETIRSTTSTLITNIGVTSSESQTSEGSGYSSLSSNPYSKLKHMSRRQLTENLFRSKDDSIIRMSDFLNSLELNQPHHIYLSKTISANASNNSKSNTLDTATAHDLHKSLKTVKHLSSSMKANTSKIYNYKYIIIIGYFYLLFFLILL